MSQVQCPNCGGYRVSTSTTTVDKQGGAPLLSCGAYAFLVVVILALFVTGIMGGLSGDLISICGLPAGVLLTVVLIRYALKTRGVARTTRYNHACELCGYKWHRLEGEPWPAIRVDPALMAQGEEQLRQADQATREAAHWNYWHNPDNPWNNPDNTST